MIAIADSKRRVTLCHARPGDRFDVEILEEGKYVLTRLEPSKSVLFFGLHQLAADSHAGRVVGGADHL
jgi:hypothetical protein